MNLELKEAPRVIAAPLFLASIGGGIPPQFSIPDSRNPVSIQCTIWRNHGKFFNHALRDEHAIKWIAVNQRQVGDAQGMTFCDMQDG